MRFPDMATNTDIPQGYKATALGIIPQEWEVKSLNKACDFLDSQRIPIKDSERAKISGIYPYYGASGIIDYVNNYIFNDDLILLAEDGANIINRSTPIAFLVNGKIWVNNHAHVLKAKPSFDRYYLCAYLESLKYDKYNTGTAQPKLNREVCEKIPILAPPLAEQRKIAEVLGVWDEAIEKQARLIEKLALRKRGLMQRLLSAKLRLPGFSEPWQKVKFCELFTKSIKTADPLKKYEVLSVTKEGIVAQKSYFNKDIASEDTSKYIVVERGDLAMSGLNFWMGSCHILTNFNEGIISPAYKVFKVNEHNNIDFIRDFVRSSMFLQALQGCSVIGASIVRRNLDKEMLYEWIFKIPSLKEQTAIAEVLTAADREIELAKEKLERLRRQKRGLMQQLLTGKKRVKY